jgi:hypothetical protein
VPPIIMSRPASMRLAIAVALAGERLDAAHLAQIHAHGIVGCRYRRRRVAGGALAALFLFAAGGRAAAAGFSTAVPSS